jgi:hypothetical protein
MELVAVALLLVEAGFGPWAVQRWRRAWRSELTLADGSPASARTLAYQLLWRAQLDRVSFEQLHLSNSS